MKKQFFAFYLAILILFSFGCTEVLTDVTTSPEITEAPLPDCSHTDSDANGFCDLCVISVTVTLDFYAVNDLHGKLLDNSLQPGIDELTSYLKTMRSVDDHAILLSSGDMWQGTSESNLTRGRIITDWMNSLGFVSMTIGNHEFDWGEDTIKENRELANFPFLAINVYDRATDTLVDYCTPSVTLEYGGATIAIIGAIGDCYSSISGDKVENIYFKTGNELNALIRAESERLRSEGVDFIILSIHEGSADASLSVEHVDLVFEGHTHKSYSKSDSSGIYHLQGGGDNDGITHAEAVVNFVTGESTVTTAEVISASVYATFSSDALVDSLMEKYASEVAKADEVLGTNAVYRTGDWLRALVARLYFEEGFKTWGEKYDIVLGGGYLSVRAPYNLSSGEVRYADLQSLFPFDNRLDLCTIKGKDLKSKFINTSNSNYFVFYGEYGQSVRYNIDDNATYYIIVDSYTSSYAPNRLTVVDSLADDLFARDLLAEYIKNGGLN